MIYVVSTMLALSLLISLVMSGLGMTITKRSFLDRSKSAAFECGFLVKNLGHVSFSLRFFLIAVVFLIFDVEISLLLMTPMVSGYGSLKIFVITFIIFISMLLWGLYLEWYNGILKWAM